jgi:FAD binding domain
VSSPQVMVVGAGPTGLLLSAELCRRGITCCVIDAHDAPLGWDRATVVHARSLEVFESIGLVDELLGEGIPVRATRLYSGGELLGELDVSDTGSRYDYDLSVPEDVTERVLTGYLQRNGGAVTRSPVWWASSPTATRSSRPWRGPMGPRLCEPSGSSAATVTTARFGSSRESTSRATTTRSTGQCSTVAWTAGPSPLTSRSPTSSPPQ